VTYALDTNTISFLLCPSRNPHVVQKFEDIVRQGSDYVIPPLCHYEINWYLQKKKATAQLKIFSDLYNDSLKNLIIDEADFVLAAKNKADLVEKGTPIGTPAALQ